MTSFGARGRRSEALLSATRKAEHAAPPPSTEGPWRAGQVPLGVAVDAEKEGDSSVRGGPLKQKSLCTVSRPERNGVPGEEVMSEEIRGRGRRDLHLPPHRVITVCL